LPRPHVSCLPAMVADVDCGGAAVLPRTDLSNTAPGFGYGRARWGAVHLIKGGAYALC